MHQTMKKIFHSFLILFFTASLTFAQSSLSDNLVILVQANNTDASLTKTERDFFTLAISKFNENITMVPEVHVHTDDINSSLMEIQKKSQIDAVQGLGSEDSAYALDKGSKAELSIKLELKNVNGKYGIICTVSNIEKKDSFQLTSEYSKLSEIYEKPIDALSYKTLDRLAKKNYIAPVSYDIKNQLLHEEDSEENYEKYIADYSTQAEQYQNQIDDLEKQNQTAEEKAVSESEKRALQLKLEMIEKRKLQAQEQLRRQQEEKSVKEKQDEERKNMKSKEREEFNKKIKELEEKKKEILSKSLGSISLQKRIELIETDKQSLKYLQNQLEQSVLDSNSFFENQCNEEIDDISNEEWRKADLSQGEPTKQAQAVRSKKIQEVKTKYANLKSNAENDLRSSIKPKLASYNSSINENIAELEKTTYVFRSVDNSDDFLSLQVDSFDGEDKTWTVHSGFEMSNIQKMDTSEIVLPNMKISYKAMTGKNAPTGDDTESYEEYQDLVDKADLYFRASVPYLYSEIALKISYDDFFDKYIAEAISFGIKKTEDGTVLFSKSEGDLTKLLKESKQREQNTEYKKQKLIQEQEKAAKEEKEKEEAREEAEERKNIAAQKRQTLKERFESKQKSRSGIYTGAAAVVSPNYTGLECYGAIYAGSKYQFSGLECWLTGSSFDINNPDFNKSLVDVQFVTGTAITLWIFRPYALAGVGIGVISDNDSSTDDSTVGLTAEAVLGSDLKVGIFSIGTFYRLKWMFQTGFADSYGISVGLCF